MRSIVALLALTFSSTSLAQPKKPPIVATCAPLSGFSIQHEGASDTWALSPDTYGGDVYIVRILDEKSGEIEIKSKASPMKYPVTVVDAQDTFVSLFGVEVGRATLITLYTSGVLTYTQHRWNKLSNKPTTKTLMSRCKVSG